MKIIDTAKRWITNWALDTHDSTAWRPIGFSGSQTAAGIAITNDNSLQISTVFACIRAISEDVAKLPLKIFQDTGDTRTALYDSYLYQLLKDKPNPIMTAMSWREAMTASALGWGNAYSLIVRGGRDEITQLWPLRPDRVVIKFGQTDRTLIYEVADGSGNRNYYSSRDILHIRGLGSDGISGYNVIQFARESLGAAKATEKFGAKFFGNGANPGAVFEHPSQMTDKAYERLKGSLATAFTGENTHKTIITEEGMKFSKISFNPEESQFLGTRQFSVAEICRWFRMPPNKVADTTRAQGWSTLEQTNIDYVTDTLMPWLIRWEQAINATLLTQDERDSGYYAKHIADALLRGDTTSRYNAYAVGRQWGWLSVNDIREKEDMNPIEDGDEYLVPLNMKNAGEEDNKKDDIGGDTSDAGDNGETDDSENEKETIDEKDALISDAAARIANAEKREIEKHIKNKKLAAWLDTFYAKHERYVIRALRPIMPESDVYAMQMIAENRYTAGENFSAWCETIETKHKEFINAHL